MTRSTLLTGLLGSLGGAGLCLLLTGHPAPARPAGSEVAVGSGAAVDRVVKGPAAASVLGAAAVRQAIRDEVRAAVRDEATALAKPVSVPAETAEVAAPPPPTGSFETARAHVAARLAQGSWSEADRERMRDLFGEMTDAERLEVMKRVSVAVNRGQLRVDLDGPTF